MKFALFRDRVDAGRQLATRLERMNLPAPFLVIALPRGGVPVAFEVAKALAAPLDVVIVRKIGAPDQPELAAGAVVDGDRPEIVMNEDVMKSLGLTQEWIEQAAKKQLVEIERRHRLYRAGRAKPPIAGHTVLVIDDGIATGASVRAALTAIRRAKPLRLILAVPVAPVDTAASLTAQVDDFLCLDTPEPFWGVGGYYEDFSQASDEEVVALLEENAASQTAPAR